MIELTLDYGFINYVANNPKVHPTAFPGRDGFVEDLSTAKKGTLFLRYGEYGLFMLSPLESNGFHYTVHTMFLPETPSTEVIKAAQEGFYFAFISLDCDKLYTSACTSNWPALRLSRRVGWKPDFTRPSMIKEGCTEHFFSLSVHEWILDNKEMFSLVGEKFHSLVEETTDHGHDPVHDCIVGAAIEMFLCGNQEKAVCMYNEWAERAYYATMVHEIDSGIVRVGDMEINVEQFKELLGDI